MCLCVSSPLHLPLFVHVFACVSWSLHSWQTVLWASTQKPAGTINPWLGPSCSAARVQHSEGFMRLGSMFVIPERWKPLSLNDFRSQNSSRISSMFLTLSLPPAYRSWGQSSHTLKERQANSKHASNRDALCSRRHPTNTINLSSSI